MRQLFLAVIAALCAGCNVVLEEPLYNAADPHVVLRPGRWEYRPDECDAGIAAEPSECRRQGTVEGVIFMSDEDAAPSELLIQPGGLRVMQVGSYSGFSFEVVRAVRSDSSGRVVAFHRAPADCPDWLETVQQLNPKPGPRDVATRCLGEALIKASLRPEPEPNFLWISDTDA